MLTRIIVKQLYGRFTYDIKLKDEGITIVTGPNGYGKSTILKIIDALSSFRLFFFLELEFSEIIIIFNTNKEVVIKKEKNILNVDGIIIDINKDMSERKLNRYGLRKRGDNWVDIRNRKVISQNDIITYLLNEDRDAILDNSLSYLFGFDDDKNKNDSIVEKILEIKELCGDVRLITEQRLFYEQPLNRVDSLRHDENYIVNVIEKAPIKLKEEINKIVDEYSKVSNKLDSSYPKRLFSAKTGLVDENEYIDQLHQANKKFEKLNEYNLVDMSLISEDNFEEKHSIALKIYFDDFSEKYKVFEQLIKKIDLFTKIINDRLNFKRIRVSPENGFEVVDDEFDEKIISLKQLSSGEKQEIILFYDLIFNTKSDLLLLIDEPEISLHIVWQKKFLDDLLEVLNIIKFQAIIATHSPQIISNHWDIQIDLGELYGE